MTWKISDRELRIYDRIGFDFKEKIIFLSGKWQNVILTGKLERNGTFINTARTAGLTESDINTVIKTLQWQLNFLKLRKDDQFSVFALREIIDGKNIQSKLVGIRLRSNGKDYYSFRADDERFYNLDGSSLTHNFIRFPVKRFHISSKFNLRRLHPITKKIVPHYGVDFAVPIGTPVLTIGDGEVIISKNGRSTGNYIVIRHNNQYITRYMHLKKLLVKSGQKVKCGDQIASSGNTGRSTGPHLHFEIWINQRPVDPLIVNLPYNERLAGHKRLKYLNKINTILPQLQFN